MSSTKKLELTTKEVKKRFVDFFTKNGHAEYPSSSLIPKDDSSIMFVNSGMVRFKNAFLNPDAMTDRRAVSIQKCVRAGGKHNDLENVGLTPRHHTFFEMLGNFSFGDYFKKEAIEMAWEFLTNEIGIDKNRLYVTVHEKDSESYQLWSRLLADSFLSDQKDRICRVKGRRGVDKSGDNWWAAGDVGPCGYCSEIFYDNGSSIKGGMTEYGFDGDRYVEIWNLVFMEFFAFESCCDGIQSIEYKKLSQKCIDTGMGFERLMSVIEGKTDNFETSVFSNIIHNICEIYKVKYGQTTKTSINVLADHIRAIVFLISDGVVPSNIDRGYVLRKIMRRAMIYEEKLSTKQRMHLLAETFIEEAQKEYPILEKQKALIVKTIKREEEDFEKLWPKGLAMLEKYKSNIENGKWGIKSEDVKECIKLIDERIKHASENERTTISTLFENPNAYYEDKEGPSFFCATLSDYLTKNTENSSLKKATQEEMRGLWIKGKELYQAEKKRNLVCVLNNFGRENHDWVAEKFAKVEKNEYSTVMEELETISWANFHNKEFGNCAMPQDQSTCFYVYMDLLYLLALFYVFGTKSQEMIAWAYASIRVNETSGLSIDVALDYLDLPGNSKVAYWDVVYGSFHQIIVNRSKQGNKKDGLKKADFERVVERDGLQKAHFDRTAQAGVDIDVEVQAYYSENLENITTSILESGGNATSDKMISRELYFVAKGSTPFYPTGGGQMSDIGTFNIKSSCTNLVGKVIDVFDIGGVIFHKLKFENEENICIQMGSITVRVDVENRKKTSANHSATHLLHAALREVLGKNVHQQGSEVSANGLRFDFNYNSPLSEVQILEIEMLVNQKIMANVDVLKKEMGLEDAKSRGAIGLFDGKYGEKVRVVEMLSRDSNGLSSSELCGGMHVERTGDILLFKILQERSVASGIRRIEAVTGMKAFEYLKIGELAIKKMKEKLSINSRKITDMDVANFEGTMAEGIALIVEDSDLLQKVNSIITKEKERDLEIESYLRGLVIEAVKNATVFDDTQIIILPLLDINLIKKLVHSIKDSMLGNILIWHARVKKENYIILFLKEKGFSETLRMVLKVLGINIEESALKRMPFFTTSVDEGKIKLFNEIRVNFDHTDK